jgi:TonB-dependent receptor
MTFPMRLRLLVGAALMPLGMASVAHAEAARDTLDALPASAALAPAFDGVFGRIVSAEGTPLPGAEIVVQGTNQRAVSNTQGEFTLPGLSGQAALNVRYMGLPSRTETVTVVPGQMTSVTITLGGDVSTLDDIIVRGVITDGVARSLNQQKNADGTVNVLSADAIGRYPDPNVAESLQRVQGIAIQRDQGEGRYINVRGAPAAFTAVSVDGVTVPSVDPGTRAVDLDTLPSDIVSNVEVSKTLLPSQDADSIAGSVNIKTRSPFDSRRLSLSGYAGMSHNDYGGEDVRGGITASNVLGADERFGALLSYSYSQTSRRPDNVESGWTKMETPDGQEIFALEESLFKDYDTERTRQAVTGGLEFRPNDTTRMWLRGSYAKFKDDEYRNQLLLTYDEDNLVAGSTSQRATFDEVTVERQLRHRTQVNEITTLTAGAEHVFGNGAILDGSLSWATTEQTYPNRNELLFRSSADPTITYDFTGDHYEPTYSLFTSNEHMDRSQYGFRETVFRSNTTEQEEFTAQANLELPASFGDQALTWKFGGKFRTRDVVADEERYRTRNSAHAPTQSYGDLLTDRESVNYDYILGHKFNNDLVDQYLNSARADGLAERRMPDSILADYTAQEDITSAYAQAKMDIGATTIIAGLRVENTGFDGSANTFRLDIDEATGDETEIFGTANVSRDDTEFWWAGLP